MENFDIAKYLKENHLGPHSILGGYVDLHALKEVEDTEDLEVVKGFGALKDKSVADKYAEVAKQAGMEGVKVVEKDGVFKIYAKAGQKLNKEADYGNNEPVDEVPYVGDEEKLDGFGDDFDQVDPVEEDMNGDDEDLSWMKDDRFADLGGDQIKAGIKSLMDDGFPTRDIAQFVVDTIRAFKSFKEEVTVSSSGVQMENDMYTVDFGTNTQDFELDRDRNVLIGLKRQMGLPGSSPRQQDIIPVMIDANGFLYTKDPRVKDISPASNASPFSDPGYMNRD